MQFLNYYQYLSRICEIYLIDKLISQFIYENKSKLKKKKQKIAQKNMMIHRLVCLSIAFYCFFIFNKNHFDQIFDEN